MSGIIMHRWRVQCFFGPHLVQDSEVDAPTSLDARKAANKIAKEAGIKATHFEAEDITIYDTVEL